MASLAGFLVWKARRERTERRLMRGCSTVTMHAADTIRRWLRSGLCSLFCLIVPGFGMAQSENATTAKTTAKTVTKKKGHTSTLPTTLPAKKHRTSAPATGKGSSHSSQGRASTHVSSPAATSSSKGKRSRGKKGSKPVAKKRGQQAIDSDRTREIQTALIREHYMQGEPTGLWDSDTQAAMQRYQADQGWQSKTTPDSRALIRLGLGPSHDHLLNPESAMTAAPTAGDPKALSKPVRPQDNAPQQ